MGKIICFFNQAFRMNNVFQGALQYTKGTTSHFSCHASGITFQILIQL